jgi:radical SAM protein with 4Fe4S-binding SPASM domain
MCLVSKTVMKHTPRLPLEGSIDLTYRCNNNCRHCWLRIPPGSSERQQELTLDELKGVVDVARKMGCRRWSISGGEPMLRPDFTEIFDYITSRCVSYSLNTNGTLITPRIAQLMKRRGSKMVAVYGATAEVHDYITRNPGSFDATLRGFAYLKEAGAGFTIQLIPMRDNYHQFSDMIELAESLSPHWRVGAAWLYLSAYGDTERNREIIRQRLSPRDVVEIDKPDLSYEEWQHSITASEARQSPTSAVGIAPAQETRPAMIQAAYSYSHLKGDDRLFASCIAVRRDFHIDPYGQMTFCGFIKEPAMLYDLRQGSFEECWEHFIPSLADKIRGGREYLDNCASCELRKDCRWCPVYGYLEHGRFSAKVEYLCAVAKENRKFKKDWEKNHRRYYQCAGITIQVDSDLPITEGTFHSKFKQFQVEGPGEDTIAIRHHFGLPNLNGQDLGKEVYHKSPWAIYKKDDSWIYLGISPKEGDERIHRVVVFNHDHTRVRIYNDQTREDSFIKGDLHSLTLFPTDQILLARVLADREGCYLHSSGVTMDGSGFLFVGHSDAGKSTIATMLQDRVEILCDDRNIVRRCPEGYRVHGTWSHGDVPDVSPSSAPLRAIMFLEQAQGNRLIPLDDRKEINRRLLACVIKPFETVDWWDKTLRLVERMAREIPCYVLKFDKSGEVVDVLKERLAI